MAQFGVIAIAKEMKEETWQDRQTGKDVKHTGLVVYVGNVSEKYDGVLPMGSRVVTGRDGSTFTVYNGKVTIWDDKLNGQLPQVGDIVNCEYTASGTLKYVGIATE